jgi:DNA-binding MarR family transcriptional regulator
MSDATLSRYDYRTLAAFRFALRRFLSFSEAAARTVGLTPRQHQALLGIKAASAEGATSMSQLAAFLILQHNSTVELIDRLEAAKLVMRTQDPADRRRVLLRLTAAGERCLADLSAVHLAELEHTRSELQKLLDHMNQTAGVEAAY